MNLKTTLLLFMGTGMIVCLTSLAALEAPPVVTGGSAQGGSATGGSVTGGTVTGGSAQGGSATGGSVTGGTVTGGSAQGGSATGGSVSSSGSASAGTVTSGTAGAGVATAFADGREIRVSSTGTVSVNVNGSTAEVAIAGQSLTVEKSRLLLDGRMLGDVPPETKKVDISMDQGTLFIKGDGKELARAKMGK